MKLVKWVVCAALVLAQVATAGAEGSLYEVRKGDRRLFLGGHDDDVLAKDFVPPVEFEHALERSQRLVLEAAWMPGTPEFQQRLVPLMAYPDGRDLSHDVSPETYAAVRAFARERRIPLKRITSFKPAFALQQIMAFEEAGGDKVVALDKYLEQLARRTGRPVGSLYSEDDMVAEMRDYSESVGDAQLLHMLRLVEWGTKHRKGESREGSSPDGVPDYLEESALSSLSVIEARNRRWLPKIAAMLQTKEIEFVLVRSPQLPGKQGLVSLLRESGFEVRPYPM